MKRFRFLLLLLFPFFTQAQTTIVTVATGVPPPVQANASYAGAFGQSPIYYYVCTRYVAGSVCQFSPAVATQTAGINNLGGGNSVTISWPAASRATGYDVMRFAQPGFSGQCSACAVALNTPATSYTDASAAAGSNYPPAGVAPVVPATGTIRLDNQDYNSPGLLWDSNGIFPFALLPLGFTSGDCAVLSAQPPFLSDSGFPCGSGGSGINQLHGDGTAGPGTGNQLFTLATVNSGSGVCGDATHVCRVTTNGKGLVTAQTATAITYPAGGLNQLTGDVTAGPGSGSQVATVAGLESVPFCTGFSPTEGQAVEWTALSAPNPCYTAATPSGGSVNFNGSPAANAIVTDFDPSHIQTPNAASTLDSSGNLSPAGNMNAGGSISSGVGTGVRSAIHITDTSTVHDQVWNGPGSGYSGSVDYPVAAPTANQVLTCLTVVTTDCQLGWATPAAGGITQLTGDGAAGPGSGSKVLTVTGLESVPFCTGFTPTEGQAVEWTALSAPNPCYTAATPAGAAITQLTGQVTAGPGSGSQVATIQSSVALAGTPTSPTPPYTANNTDIATTNYVRVLLGSLNPATAVAAATTAVLSFSPAYSNGSSGIGATLTATSFGALVVDSYTVLLGNRVLVNNQAAALQNGVYTLTTLGTGGADYILTRTSDFNTVNAINNAGVIPVVNGTVNAGTDWALAASISSIGASPINYALTGVPTGGGATVNQNIRTIGAVLTPAALTSCVYVAFAGTINAFHAVAGDGATVDTVLVKVETQPTFATFISTGVSGASDISNGGEQLTSVLGKVDTTLTSWTTTLAAGTTVCFVGSTFSAGTSVNANINVAAN